MEIVRKVVDKLIFGGVTKLTPLEESLFDAAHKFLPSEISEPIKLQLRSIRLIQKHLKNKQIGYILKDGYAGPTVPNQPKDTEVKLLKFRYQIDRKRYTSNLITWEGVISRLETSSGIPKEVLKKQCDDCSCDLTQSIEKTLAEELHEEEHGDLKI